MKRKLFLGILGAIAAVPAALKAKAEPQPVAPISENYIEGVPRYVSVLPVLTTKCIWLDGFDVTVPSQIRADVYAAQLAELRRRARG